MKYLFILLITFISSIALAAPGSHSPLTADNPHTKSACASQKGKVSQFHGKDWKNARSEAKTDSKSIKKVTNLKNYI